MTEYKLKYFNMRGRAEPIRWIFHFVGMDFIDERIEFADWPTVKEETPHGQLPTLEYRGRTFYQSAAIGRFLSRQFGLFGADDITAAFCDQLVDTLNELVDKFTAWATEGDEEKKEELLKGLVDTHIPHYIEYFEKTVEKTEGKYAVDFGITWADIFLAAWMENFVKLKEDCLDDCPNLTAMVENIRNMGGIKDWIDSRPDTQL